MFLITKEMAVTKGNDSLELNDVSLIKESLPTFLKEKIPPFLANFLKAKVNNPEVGTLGHILVTAINQK